MSQGKPCYRTAIECLQKDSVRLRLASILYATGVLLDYLFVYTLKIRESDTQKCVHLNRSLGFTAFVFRSLLEILNVIVFYPMFEGKFKNFKSEMRQKFKFENFKSEMRQTFKEKKFISRILLGNTNTSEQFQDFLMFHQIFSFILVAIGWQVMLIISLTSKTRLIFIALNYLLVLHLPRLFVVVQILSKRQKTSLSRFRTKFASLFFFVYIYSIQLFAALWYLPAMHKETRCWKEAYTNWPGKKDGYSAFNCSEKSQDEVNFISDYCSTRSTYVVYNCTVISPKGNNSSGNVWANCSTNATKYEFGIYGPVHQDKILGKESCLLKILYFSRWALQCLSSFAQGLEAGVDIWQNLFIIFIIAYGVFLFFFLIGELQSEWERVANLNATLRKKKQWMKEKEISDDLQFEIRKNEADDWPRPKDVTIENMFHDLRGDVSGKLSQELCLKRLEKVDELGKWDEDSRKELCDCVKPVFYQKGTQVIKKEDPINELLFVVQGELWTYPSRCKTKDSESTSSCNDNKNDLMKAGDVHGEELFEWVRDKSDNPYSFDFPQSTVTIQAVTNVEAFVLMAYDLKKIFIKQSEKQRPIPAEEADTQSTVPAVVPGVA